MTSRFQNKSATDDYLKFKEKDKYPNRKSTFVTKQFEKRQAVITQLLEDNIHIQAVYNIVLSLSLFTMFTLNLKELSDHGRLSPAIDLIFEKFGKLHIVFLIWLANNLLSFFCYYCFILWNTARGKLKKRQFFDKICFILVAIYYAFIFYAIPVLIRYFDIPFASSCIILCEAVRLLMKVHAFIRSNAPKVLSSNTEKETVQLPSVKKFAQFLYLPTSVYRDDYPRSENIRWDFVTHRLFEILWVIISLAHVHIYTVVPIFKTVCLTPITTTKFIVLLFKVAVPSLLTLCLLFLACLHSTQEAVGEVIHCGDRMTYSDWWNSLDLQQFYKKWNWAVGDWLYTYVNKDLTEVVFPGRSTLSRVLTVVISALVHEWVLTAATGFFCPIIFFMMMFSIFLSVYAKVKTNKNLYRLINWFLVPIGPGIIAVFIFVEYFARINLPMKSNEMSVFWNNCLA